MPHLTIEYTDNLSQFNTDRALRHLNEVLTGSGEFQDTSIKSRAIRLEAFRIGSSASGRAFVSVKLALLSGRSVQTKHEISESLLRALETVCEWPESLRVQLCVEVLEIERECYSRMFVGAQPGASESR